MLCLRGGPVERPLTVPNATEFPPTEFPLTGAVRKSQTLSTPTPLQRPTALLQDAAVFEADDAVGPLHGVLVVCRQNQGGLTLRHQRVEELEHLRSGAAVQRARGFVGQDERRLLDEGPGDGDALLLAAREGVRVGGFFVRESDLAQELTRSLANLLGAVRPRDSATEAGREANVVEDIERRNQIEELKHEADLFATEA